MNMRTLARCSDWRGRQSVLAAAAIVMWTAVSSVSAQTVTNLHSFAGGGDGDSPYAGLVLNSNGFFYGTTSHGGASSWGMFFMMASNGTVTPLYSFTGGGDGGNPGDLILGRDGSFYGTTGSGGAGSFGTVFKITTNGSLTTLHSFNWDDGCAAGGKLLQSGDGNLYGTTLWGGGESRSGTVFRITLAGALTTLHSFKGGAIEGAEPNDGVVQGRDGSFYGTTRFGGKVVGTGWASYNCGTVFRLASNGTFTTLHMFSNRSDGGGPRVGLTIGNDGAFYGATCGGGASDHGTLFKITSSGTFTTLHSFTGGDEGYGPDARLFRASDGNFYGMVSSDDPSNMVFRVKPNGVLAALYAFDDAKGSLFAGELVQGTDGDIYGTAVSGGAFGYGTVYRFTPPPFSNLYPTGPTGTVTSTRRPVFAWTSQTDATWYYLWLSRNGATYKKQWVEAATNWTPSADLPAGNYHWWIRAWNGPEGFLTAWSSTISFTIPSRVPGAIVSLAPAGIDGQTNRPTFVWTADNNATWYYLWINKGASTYLKTWVPTVTNYTHASTLPFATYTWRVQGWSADGYGPWSGSKTFTLGLSRALSPTGTVVGISRPQFNWSASSGATWYYLWINRAGAIYKQQWVNGVTTNWTPAADMPLGNYQWWIRAWNAQSGNGPWSTTAAFTLQ